MKLFKILPMAAISSLICLTSCYDLDLSPDSSLSSSSFFQTESHAKQAMMAVYSQMQNDYVFGCNFGLDVLGGVSTGYDAFPGMSAFQNGTVAVNNGVVSSTWQNLYEGIARANNILQNIDNVDMSSTLIAQYTGEARFMRALYYFQLLNLYGGVPLYDETTIISEEFTEMKKPRSTVEETRNFILADLTAAETNLPASWDSANQGRATSGAATALKGKVLLYGQQYQAASQAFSQVINSGLYQLYPDYPNLFTPTGDESSEMIFAIQNLGGVGQDIGMPLAFYLGTRATFGSDWNNVMPATSFVDSFEWNDGRPFDWDEFIPGYTEDQELRYEVWYSIPNEGFNSIVEYTPYREQLLEMYSQRDPRMMWNIILPYTNYIGWRSLQDTEFEYGLFDGNVADDNGTLLRPNGNRKLYLYRKFVPEGNMGGLINNRADTPINYALIRYADVLLMQAECLNELGDQNGAVALVNQVRARSHMPGINSGPSYLAATGKDEVFQRIKHERAVELCCEGHSYFDMKRWGLLQTLNDKKEMYIPLNGANVTRVVTERYNLWPIPSGEIDKNPDLTQNPGWN